MQRFLTLFLLLSLCLFGVSAAAVQEEIKIGILAKRGVAKTFEKWSPTAEYLSKKLPQYRFEIVPLGFDEVQDAVRKREISFIIANSAYYVDMEYRYGISRIATLQNLHSNGKGYCRFGGVIFTRSNRSDIYHISDLKGKRFAAVDPQSFGGWEMAWHVLHHAGVDPYDDFASLHFSGTHDQVVYDVLSGKADAGTVRSDTLERMEHEGKIRLANLYIINQQWHEGFDFVHSTQLYPEWPIAKLSHVDNKLAKEVAIALMEMSPEDEAAISSLITGWSIPATYQSVHNVLKELQIGPYEYLREVTLEEVFRQYWHYLLLMLIALIASIVVIAMIAKLNRGLKEGKLRLEREVRYKDLAQRALKERSDELAEANEKLHELDKLKSMFIASMSHEFRTPLNSIIGFTGVMLQQMPGKINEKQQDFLTRIKLAGEHLLGLISDVIDISKIEADRIEAFPESFMLEELTTQATDEISVLAKKKGLQLSVDAPEGIEMFSDRRRLMQCLLNYLSNAVKFTERGTIVLKVVDLGERVEIAVEDTGIGIAQEDLPKLFEAFERLDTHLRVKAGGTGLGLYLTKRIVEGLLGGEVYVESTIEKGSVFGLRIPKRIAVEEGNA